MACRIFGPLVPSVLKRMGAAIASSIFVATTTHVISVGLLLSLASLLVL